MNDDPLKVDLSKDEASITNGAKNMMVAGTPKSTPYKSNCDCPLCDVTIGAESLLNNHLLVHHLADGPFECPDCAQLYENLEMFEQHWTTIHNYSNNNTLNEPTESDQNDIDNEEDSSMPLIIDDDDDDHEHKVSDIQIIYSCTSCTAPFTTDDIHKYNEHMKQHIIEPEKDLTKTKICDTKPPSSLAPWQQRDNKIRNFICDTCQASFTLGSSLALHFRRKHLGIKPFECNECDRAFAQSSDLDKHRRRHTGERPYICHVCGISFSQLRNLKNHQKMHTDAPSQCPYCPKEFAIDTSLRQHLKKHEGPDAVTCDLCSIPFTRPYDLEMHKKRTHSDSLSLMVNASEKPHQCERCDKTFAKAYDLKKHQRIHTGRK